MEFSVGSTFHRWNIVSPLPPAELLMIWDARMVWHSIIYGFNHIKTVYIFLFRLHHILFYKTLWERSIKNFEHNTSWTSEMYFRNYWGLYQVFNSIVLDTRHSEHERKVSKKGVTDVKNVFWLNRMDYHFDQSIALPIQ